MFKLPKSATLTKPCGFSSQDTAMWALQGVLSDVRGPGAFAILALTQVFRQGHEDLDAARTGGFQLVIRVPQYIVGCFLLGKSPT